MKLRRDRRDIRRKGAKTRQAEYNAMTPQEKIKALDERLGNGIGAKKERARLLGKVKGNEKIK